jgi:hypothetical protein
MTVSIDGNAAATLRAWAKAYLETPALRFPSDPDAEFFPRDMEFSAAKIERLTAKNERLRSVIEELVLRHDIGDGGMSVASFDAWVRARNVISSEKQELDIPPRPLF